MCLRSVVPRLLLLAALLPARLHAGGTVAEPVALEAVKVKATAPAGAPDSASIGTVYSEQFEHRPLTRPGELLEAVPGLIVTQHGGEGKANQYFLRGFNLDHGTDFASFVDGVPVNLPSHAHGQGYTDLNFLIPELVDAIQYRKGPYYAQYGDFSSAGAADLRYRDRMEASYIQATAGEYGYARLVGAASPRLAGGDLLLGVEGLHYDGPFARHDNFDKGSLVLRYSRGGEAERWHAELLGYQAHFDSSDQIPQRAVAAGRIGPFGCIDCSDAGSTYRFSLSGGFERRLGHGRISVSLYAVRYGLQLYSDFTYFLNAGKLSLLRGKSFEPDRKLPTDQIEQLDRRSYVGGQALYRFPAELASLRLQNLVGVQTRYDGIEPDGLYDTQQRRRFLTVSQTAVGECSASAFAETDARITSWARLVVGARYDDYRYSVGAGDPVNSGSGSAGIASPKLALVFGPFARTELFLNAGKGFHGNDVRGAVQRQRPVSAADPLPAVASPVTPLPASRGADFGIRSNWLPHTQLAASLFVLDLDSELRLDGDTGATSPGPATRRSGIETSAYWRPRPHLVIDADFAYAHARYRSPVAVGTPEPAHPEAHGRRIAEAPTSVAAFGATYESPHGWDAALRLRYFGPRPLQEDDSVSSHATLLLNAGVDFSLAPHLELGLQGTNLLDRRDHDIDYYYSSRLPGEEGSGVGDIHFHPVEPINGRVVLTYRY